MNRQEILDDIRAKFGSDIMDFSDRSARRVYVEVAPMALPRFAAYLFRTQEARFHVASGLDARSHFEILYHFSIERLNLLISLRVKLEKATPTIPSIAGIIKGANWIEREIAEMLGIEFQGHPRPERLLLGEQWPAGVHPLRRDYEEWDPEAIRDRGV